MVRTTYENWLRNDLFERAPLYISVIDRDYRIVAANRNFVERFGEANGHRCYEIHMRRADICEDCAVARTFEDGKPRKNVKMGFDRHGRPAHYKVHIAPIVGADGSISHVIEMSTDISDTMRVQLEYQTLFEQVPCYVTVMNRDLDIVRANAHFRRKFGEIGDRKCFEVFKRREEPCESCPAREVFADGRRHTAEQTGVGKSGETTRYVMTAAPADPPGEKLERVMEMAVDVTALRAAERERIEAERLAAVGQTVAGLAHGIKNILTGLEGGMYFLKSGLDRGRKERLEEGWGMLERNVERISVLVRNLLSFSKGRVPHVEVCDPRRFVTEMVDLYQEAAAKEDIVIAPEIASSVGPAPFDAEAIHTCLANLVSNAIDACQTADRKPCHVFVRLREEGESLLYEVEDEGCGMDQKVHKLAFTNFFTTKGGGGTGLGLLLTRKITQEHGGRIESETTLGEGSCFRLIFPRDRLPEPKDGAAEEESP